MASIYKELSVDNSAAQVWERLRDFYALHERLVPGFVTACHEENGARVITFFNGLVTRERLVSIDDANLRLSYTVEGGKAAHHHASAQVFADGKDRCRFVWITDVLPDEMATPIGQMMDRGLVAMKTALSAGGPSAKSR
jgi:polyketide cyclase/dehydrase/lipid transport protein